MKNTVKNVSKDDMKKIIKEEAPQEKKKPVGKTILHVVEAIIGGAYLLFMLLGRFFIPQEGALYEYYQSVDILSKTNPIPLIRLASYALLTVSLGTILRLIIMGLSKNKNVTKKTGVAIIQLLANLVKYLMVIVIICLVLSAIGIDIAAIFAGLGIVALIIGLGVTSLIEDIVAGIFIIAERLFDVGDIIVVDGFRGTVVSIGIRSTKLADVGGDILTMRNSSIGSLVNLTDRTSCAALTIPLAPDENLKHVEEVIKNGHIEKIKDTCAKMVSEPMYLGLCDITSKGVQMLLFIAACKEDDRYDVERALFHGLKVLFEENDIKLGHPVVLVEEDEQ